jgi:tetratricopeptide (TPR) repeat protein
VLPDNSNTKHKTFIIILEFTMMIEQFRRHVATISSEGIQCIEQGHFDEAVELYRNGLNWIKAAMMQPNDTEREDEHELASSSSDSCADSIPQIRFALQRRSPLPCSSAAAEQQLFIYKKPLEFSEGERYSHDQSCFVLIYNLALSYHLSATSCSKQEDEKAKRLSKTALELWELVYRLHRREDMGVTCIHTCPILNNLGQLYHVSGDLEMSRHCFTTLLSVMHSLEGSCDPDFLSAFMNNVMSLVALNTTIAAPAA